MAQIVTVKLVQRVLNDIHTRKRLKAFNTRPRIYFDLTPDSVVDNERRTPKLFRQYLGQVVESLGFTADNLQVTWRWYHKGWHDARPGFIVMKGSSIADGRFDIFVDIRRTQSDVVLLTRNQHKDVIDCVSQSIVGA